VSHLASLKLLAYILLLLSALPSLGRQSDDRNSPQLGTPGIAALQNAAEKGDAVDERKLAEAYDKGEGIERNDDLAVKWYRKAADQGDATAESQLGVMYFLGRGVERNKEEAVRWYHQAAKQGSSKAMFNLGAAYYNGEGVGENAVQAYAWFLLAQEAGSSPAADAVRRSASELGEQWSADAFIRVGEMYVKGVELPQNYSEAARWYRKVADRNPDAALRLAVILINGTGVTQNYTEAMSLCETAAKKNYPPAEYCVGYLHLRGLGITPDAKEAAKWFSEAATQGFAKAAFSLSEMYLKGEGVTASRADAFYFLYAAYRGGVYPAKEQARALRQTLTKDETKRTEKILLEHSLDPKKVFAIVDDTTPRDPSQTREILSPPIR
jgi:uncharacterized protein